MKLITSNNNQKLFLEKLIRDIKLARYSKKNHFSTVVGRSKFIVWGYGEAYNAFDRSVLQVVNRKPFFLMDKKVVNKKNYLSKENFIKWEISKKNNFVYIVCTGYEKNFKKIKNELLRFGVKREKIVWVVKIYEFNIHTFEKKFSNNIGFISSINKIRKAFNLLTDLKSKEIYLKLLNIYISHEPKKIPYSRDEQYFPKKIFKSIDFKNIINCGAYNGDTLNVYSKKYKSIMENGLFFEADKKNFKKLFIKSNLIKKKNKKFNLSCMNYALSNTNGFIYFDSNKGLSSKVTKIKRHAAKIKCRSLDAELKNKANKKWFLILDCEGHEIKVLGGSKENIKKGNFNMAVSIYHKISDLWDIILLLKTYKKNLKFFIKNYSGFTYETILYVKKN